MTAPTGFGPAELPGLERVAGPLREATQQAWQRYCERAGQAGIPPAGITGGIHDLARVWSCSPFVARVCAMQPGLLAHWQDTALLDTRLTGPDFQAHVQAGVDSDATDERLMQQLRQLRNAEMARIAWRDISGRADLAETLDDLSNFADAVLQFGLDHLHRQLVAVYGEPTGPDGTPLQMVVLSLGKLGARELNFSSDIDLMFCFEAAGETRGGGRRCSNEEFFVRLGQRLIKLLGKQTSDGFVFRVDMRLRPFGDSGPLACSFPFLMDYYQVHGRDWERYALIRARVSAGDQHQGRQLIEALRPFIYRRYVDFGVFESLRNMKELIDADIKRKDKQDNVKLGPGGIREIEFITQVLQLIRGGREPELRTGKLTEALQRLGDRGYLPDYAVPMLVQAYAFLRQTEHRLQQVDDQQTHQLPAPGHDPNSEPACLRLALGMGFDGWSAFAATLDKHRRNVQGQFELVFMAPQTAAGSDDSATGTGPATWQQLWLQASTADEQDWPDGPASGCVPMLARFGHSRQVRTMSAQGRERLDRLMPLLLAANHELALDGRDGTTVLPRLLTVLEAIAGRSVYLSLLTEQPMALTQLIRLCAASPWITQLIARHPVLLDELLDPQALYQIPERPALEQQLQKALANSSADDEEQQLETLRRFRQSSALHIAAAEITGALSTTAVSSGLSLIAEVLLTQSLQLAQRQMEQRYGIPHCRDGERDWQPGFAIIAYGKLGGREMGYGSDLDLVFLHDSQGHEQTTDGDSPVDNNVFFARMAKRVIHVLTTRMPGGKLYDVDLRLRPSGASGLLVSSLAAFHDYQCNKAWTWEHQALIRARYICGSPAIADRFGVIRTDILTSQRDPLALQRDVTDMRERMRAGKPPAPKGQFDLKQGPGGIADIEFMVQYAVLRWSAQHPELVAYTDNLHLLDALAASGRISAADRALLTEAYLAYRTELHRLVLQEQPGLVDDDAFRPLRDEVAALWQRWFTV